MALDTRGFFFGVFLATFHAMFFATSGAILPSACAECLLQRFVVALHLLLRLQGHKMLSVLFAAFLVDQVRSLPSLPIVLFAKGALLLLEWENPRSSHKQQQTGTNSDRHRTSANFHNNFVFSSCHEQTLLVPFLGNVAWRQLSL